MRLVPVKNLEFGDVLGKPILGEDGRVLLRAGVALSSGYILKLQQKHYTYVYIQDSQTEDIEMDDIMSLSVQQEILVKIKSIYEKMQDPRVSEKLVKSGGLGKDFGRLFQIMFDALMADHTFVVNVLALFSSDAYLYTHSMNVGVIASILGVANGLNQDRLRTLGLGAMLHDIGKTKIDGRILNKPGQLTAEEREAIQQHSRLGYEIIKHQDMPLVAAHCAYQHHEKYDGTGYPRKLKGEQIHDFGRLLAVADVYDALTSNRSYRKAMLPNEAVEYLYAHCGKQFDPKMVSLFTQHVNIYPNGLPVRLSSGVEGVVACYNLGNLQRPVVRVLTENGHPVIPYEVDLSKQLNVTITSVDFEDLKIERDA